MPAPVLTPGLGTATFPTTGTEPVIVPAQGGGPVVAPSIGFDICRRTAWPGTTLDMVALPTDLGRAYLARSIAGDLGFKVVEFAVGRGGYDPAFPLQPLPINPTDTELEDEVFRDRVDDVQSPNDLAFAFLCRLEAPEALAGLGELGLWAEVVWSLDPSEVGEKFMIVLVHFPLRGKTRRHIEGFRVICQF